MRFKEFFIGKLTENSKSTGKWINGKWVKNATPKVHQPTEYIDKTLTKQDALYKKIEQIDIQYDKDGDINKAIQEYESIFTPDNIPLIMSQRALLTLPQLYILNNQRDKAWGFYNLLLIKSSISRSKIRDCQA